MITPRSDSYIKETLVVSGLASLLLLIISWPAFKYFFFGEAFGYLQIYDRHGRHLWQAAFSDIGGIFFWALFFFSRVLGHFVFPPGSLTYHVREFVFFWFNLFFLHPN